MTDPVARQPHANLDATSRRDKARKIERLLAHASLPVRSPLRLLEIGTGSGDIAAYFGRHAGRTYVVDAVDTTDQRLASEGYCFQKVSSARLPFPEAAFDVVISNHVIEHVGSEAEQLEHLKEMSRVLRPDGVIYLASPNRWQWTEPHYHLAALSWLPRFWRSRYLALRGKGRFYDCEPLSKRSLEQMLLRIPLMARNLCAEAMSDILKHQLAGRPSARVLRSVPPWMWHGLAGICPTHVYLLTKPSR